MSGSFSNTMVSPMNMSNNAGVGNQTMLLNASSQSKLSFNQTGSNLNLNQSSRENLGVSHGPGTLQLNLSGLTTKSSGTIGGSGNNQAANQFSTLISNNQEQR